MGIDTLRSGELPYHLAVAPYRDPDEYTYDKPHRSPYCDCDLEPIGYTYRRTFAESITDTIANLYPSTYTVAFPNGHRIVYAHPRH